MDPEKLMRHVVKSFEETDLEPLIEALHDDVVWKSASKQENVFRFGGDYYSKLGVLDALSHILMDYTIHHMRPREILASGNVVWGLFDVELDYDHKGMDPVGKSDQNKAIELEVVIRWRLRDGKIIEHQSFFDTASLLIQQGHPSAN
ncbi:MAG TPA: nuclear transport factor 2 family protein [Rhizomicrobium sp.]|jgi:ketosteroid isomerase-like protein|nr:nuclear transport factor 2 family protein [Rhizomicrobium sp.]